MLVLNLFLDKTFDCMEAEKLRISQAIKRLEKEIALSNKLLSEIDVLQNSLNSVFNEAALLEERVQEDSVLLNHFKSQTDLKKLISSFKDLQVKLHEMKSLSDSVFEKSSRIDLFFESFREYRMYEFEDFQKTLSFLSQASELYSVSFHTFKPQYLGALNFSEIANPLKLEFSSSSITVPSEKLSDFLKILLKTNALKNSRIESSAFKAVFKERNSLSVNAENSKLKRLDRLAKELNGKVFD